MKFKSLENYDNKDLKLIVNVMTDMMFEKTGDIRFKCIRIEDDIHTKMVDILDPSKKIEKYQSKKLYDLLNELNLLIDDMLDN